MKTSCLIFLLLCLLLVLPVLANGESALLIDTDSVDALMVAENPLPLLEETLTEYFKNDPVACMYFASELNLSNGSLKDTRHINLGERLMFGQLVNNKTVRDWDGDIDAVADEVLRILFGPWYSANAYTIGVKSRLNCAKQLNLGTGEWVRAQPQDIAIRITHYTDYYGSLRLATIGLTIDRSVLYDGQYKCDLTILRK